MRLAGWEVSLPAASTPTALHRCASCGGAPATGVPFLCPGRWLLQVPLCVPCAERRRVPVLRVAAIGILTGVAMGVVTGLVDAFALALPPALVLLAPAPLTLALGIAIYGMLAPRVPPPPATAPRMPVKLVSNGPEKVVLFCTHEAFARDLAASVGGSLAPASRRSFFLEGMLAVLPGVGLAGIMAMAIWDGNYREVHIDNAGTSALTIWVDGKPVLAAPPNGEGKEPSIRLPRGKHTLGWSISSAAAPEQVETINVDRRTSYLYNPGNTGCYWRSVTMYGMTGGRPTAERWAPTEFAGPLSIQELYTFDRVDSWFRDPPPIIQDKRENLFRVSVHRNPPCMELVARDCPIDVRRRLVSCQARAKTASDVQACSAEADAACKNR